MTDATADRARIAVEAGLAVLGAVLIGLGIASVVPNDAIRMSYRVWQAAAGSLAIACTLAAVVLASRSERWTARLLGLGLLAALVYSWVDGGPPLAALPILLAFLISLRPILARQAEPGVDFTRSRTVVAFGSLVLMVPIWMFYAGLGLLAPGWAVVVGQALFLVIAVGTVWLAARRTYLTVAGPAVAVACWFGGLWAGEYFLGWTA